MLAQSLLSTQELDVAIIGAGPVGLALAIELARTGLAVLVIDRRPPPELDARLRPQLLVAREGDLANLDALGVDIRDPQIVSLLATRCEGDLVTGRSVTGQVRVIRDTPERVTDLSALAAQPPVALVPTVVSSKRCSSARSSMVLASCMAATSSACAATLASRR